MADGPNKIKLTHYLTGAQEGDIGAAGVDWSSKGAMLQIISAALQKQGPSLARALGEDSKTADRLTEVLLESAHDMHSQGVRLEAAGEALSDVGGTLQTARIERGAMTDLTAPPPYRAPTYAPGVQPTPAQIGQAAHDRTVSNNQHTAYQDAFDAQENAAAHTLAKLDAAFVGAIPPMTAIHGGPDPTAPTPGTPGTPGAPTAPTQGPGGSMPPRVNGPRVPNDDPPRPPRDDDLPRPPRDDDPPRVPTTQPPHHPGYPPHHTSPDPTSPDHPARQPGHAASTNVQGGTDGGTGYRGAPGGSPSSGGLGGNSAGVGGAAAAGAAGAGLGAGMLKGGAVRGSVPARSSGSVRGIGAGGRAAAPGSLGRGSSAAGSSARGASSGARATGSTSATRGSSASSASRSAGAGGRTGAAGSAQGSGKGSGKGLFRRGANGSASGGRSEKSRDDRGSERDSLVYEQDWLGEDTAGPGVLD